MTSSTSLYPESSGNANVASRNFTTLYSGSGAITVQQDDNYGNANVVALLAAGTDGVGNTIGNISATGNVTAAYFIGNGSQLSNISAANIVGAYGNANVTALLGNLGSNAISTTGNVTAGYFQGNGSQLTGIVSTYGNANVSAYLASGTNSANIITTANVIAATLKTSGVSGNIVGADYVSANFYLGDGGLLSNITSSYGNANVSAYLSSGTITANILTTGAVSATGNITGSYILGNGSQLTGLPATYGNANVTALLSNLGSNAISTTGNVTAANFFGNVTGNIVGNVVVPGANTEILINNAGNIGTGPGFTFNTAANALSVPGTVSATGNITGSYFLGNGSTLGSITGANVTGTVASANAAVTAGTVTSNAQANITSVGTLTGLTVTGNTATGGVLTDNYYYANGTPISFGGSYSNANVVSLMAAFGSNTITTTGNVALGNLQVTGNIVDTGALTIITGSNGNIALAPNGTGLVTVSSALSVTGNVTGNYFIGNGSQLTGITTSAGGSNTQVQFNDGGVLAGNVALTLDKTTGRVQAGNITTTGSIINTANIWTDTTGVSPSTIIIGNGYSGNYSTTYLTNNQRNTRMSLMDLLTATDNGARKTELASAVYYDLAGNVTYGTANLNSRLQCSTNEMYIQNGNTVNSSVNFIRSGTFAITAGQSANVGNANLATAAALQTFTVSNNGSRIGNAYGIAATTTGNTAQGGLMPTAIMFTALPSHQPGSGVVDVGNIFNYYTPGSTNTFGTNTGNTTRVANYWNIYNEDNANKNRLGALTQYQETSYSLTSSAGSVVVNKANGQVQYYAVSEAATMSFTGFITVATIPVGGGVPTAVNRYQTDTVTVIVQQDATGRTITMPSGAAFKYSGGVSTVPATANSISMISITAYYNPATSATAYLTTISPAFT
jgi:hypothetical protein